ncbi:MAG: hypothetical protein R3C68_07330 [Myxococcota bacterium]
MHFVLTLALLSSHSPINEDSTVAPQASHGFEQVTHDVDATQKTDRQWYRGQLTLGYLGTIGGFILLAQTNILVLAMTPGLIPSIVHGMHGNYGRAALSAVGQIGAGGLGAFIGVRLSDSDCQNDDVVGCTLVGGVLGAAAGYLTWAIVDIAFFAYEDKISPFAFGIQPTAGGAYGALTYRF